jgi:hypothetical protein
MKKRKKLNKVILEQMLKSILSGEGPEGWLNPTRIKEDAFQASGVGKLIQDTRLNKESCIEVLVNRDGNLAVRTPSGTTTIQKQVLHSILGALSKDNFIDRSSLGGLMDEDIEDSFEGEEDTKLDSKKKKKIIQ